MGSPYVLLYMWAAWLVCYLESQLLNPIECLEMLASTNFSGLLLLISRSRAAAWAEDAVAVFSLF